MNNLHVETFSEPQQKEITHRCAYLLLLCSIDFFFKNGIHITYGFVLFLGG